MQNLKEFSNHPQPSEAQPQTFPLKDWRGKCEVWYRLSTVYLCAFPCAAGEKASMSWTHSNHSGERFLGHNATPARLTTGPHRQHIIFCVCMYRPKISKCTNIDFYHWNIFHKYKYKTELAEFYTCCLIHICDMQFSFMALHKNVQNYVPCFTYLGLRCLS